MVNLAMGSVPIKPVSSLKFPVVSLGLTLNSKLITKNDEGGR